MFDNPNLVVACVIGDGEAETGPLATAWHSNKFLDPVTDGAVLPILHLNGYKIANPTLLARITREELEQLLRGYGWTPYFVEGHEPGPMHEAMAAMLDMAVEQIKKIQQDARIHGNFVRPRWPMIVLKSPKGWTGPKMVDGLQVEGTFRAHQVPVSDPAPIPSTSSCSKTGSGVTGPRRSSMSRAASKPNSPNGAEGRTTHGGESECQRRHAAPGPAVPEFREYAVNVPSPGAPGIGDTHVLGRFCVTWRS